MKCSRRFNCRGVKNGQYLDVIPSQNLVMIRMSELHYADNLG